PKAGFSWASSGGAVSGPGFRRRQGPTGERQGILRRRACCCARYSKVRIARAIETTSGCNLAERTHLIAGRRPVHEIVEPGALAVAESTCTVTPALFVRARRQRAG